MQTDLGILPLKYRPKSWDEMIGNEATIKSIKSVLSRETKDIPHTVMFTGPHGTGKTSSARIFAKEVGCADMHVIEHDAGSDGGVSAARQIISSAQFCPMVEKGEKALRAFIIDESHKITEAAGSAFLKTLEEPPPHTFFLLCTTDPSKMLKTLRSRGPVFEFQTVSEEAIVARLKEICGKEGIDLSDKILCKIAESSEGHVRDAIRTLDQVIDMEDEESIMQIVSAGVGGDVNAFEICKILANPRDTAKWGKIVPILEGVNGGWEGLRISTLGYMTAIVKNPKSKPEMTDYAAAVASCFLEPLYSSDAKHKFALSCYAACKE